MQFVSNTTRRTIARSAGALVVIASALISACSSDTATQPELATRNGLLSTTTDLLSTLIPVKAVTRDTAVAPGLVRSFTFDKKGGKIEIKETGLVVTVPEDAIPGEQLTITVTALPGKTIAYDFQPHGTVFRKPLVFTQDLKNTSWDKSLLKGTVNGGYFKNTKQIDLTNATALLDEIFAVTFNKKEASFNINHFSGYMVSGGRKGLADESMEF